MNVKRVLCPVDFSDSNEFTLAYATKLAKESDAELHIVHAYEEPYAGIDGGFAAYIPPADLQPMRESLDKVEPPYGYTNFHREFLIGPPIDTLLEYIDEKKIDLCVIGTHGRTGLSRLLMGSVAEAIVRRANCPVLTLKRPMDETADKAKGAEAAKS